MMSYFILPGLIMQIKKIVFLLAILLFTHFTLYAEGFSKSASLEPVLVQKGSSKHWCPVCGMDLKMFYKTNHVSKHSHGEERQYCSVRCLVVDMQEFAIKKEDIKVVDAKTEKLINAASAFYVLGSDVKGTMSHVSKLAFASKEDALEFIKENKGTIVDFDTVLKEAKESLKSDTAMTDEKKSKKVYPMGKKIFQEMCKSDIDANKYVEIHELKASLVEDKLCKPLKEQQLQAVALYLWEVKKVGDNKAVLGKIEVQKDEKCPVCGMFVYKYPKWVAQIYYETKGAEHHHSFDGVKDMIKFYFNPQSWGNYKTSTHENISKILVTDYYSQKAIDAREAFFVIGSDVYGPMGSELIPFLNESDAKTFSQDHKGKKIVQFKNVTQSDIKK